MILVGVYDYLRRLFNADKNVGASIVDTLSFLVMEIAAMKSSSLTNHPTFSDRSRSTDRLVYTRPSNLYTAAVEDSISLSSETMMSLGVALEMMYSSASTPGGSEMIVNIPEKMVRR